MANTIDATGINIQSVNEIVDELTEGYKSIYGQDINVGASTPDGSMINIQAQAKADILDYSVMLYNCFNVDAVRGTPQDILYKINNVYRTAPEYSYVEINVTTNRGVNLQGLDDNYQDQNATGYTVSDSNGNEFILLNSAVITSAGTFTLEFRAKNLGAIEVIPNTITTMVTIVAGVVEVNNPAVQYITGANEESDAEFRMRRNKSTAISGTGFQDSLDGQLLSIPSVSFAKVWNNRTNAVDADGVPAHGVWCIVQGGANANIARVIYNNVGFGVPMKGEQTYTIIKENGDSEVISFDRPISQPLHIRLTLVSKSGSAIDVNYIKEQLAQNMIFGVYESVDISQVSTEVTVIDSDVYVTACQLSANGTTWVNYLLPPTKQGFFTLDSSNITITV